MLATNYNQLVEFFVYQTQGVDNVDVVTQALEMAGQHQSSRDDAEAPTTPGGSVVE